MTAITFLLALTSLLVQYSVCDEIIVTLPSGQIRGSTKVTHYKNVTFFAFQQVPFGQPPIGKLRFMPPQPVKNWDGILDCTQNQRICFQTTGDDDLESEDCLFLNVYTPEEPGNNSSLPVMFYMFGGGFVDGTAIYNMYAPHFFVEQGVILVTVSYRVGSFGFLSSGDEVILGNMGLKDQNLGLQWVRDNIHLFGGDKTKVTIFGESAGAASVAYQILSKQSTGLFRGAIAQSGTALCPWAYQRNATNIAYQVANFIDANFGLNHTSQELLEFLQNVDASILDAASNKFHESVGHEQLVQGFWYAPVVEPNVEGAFITEYMYETLEGGNINKIPLMIGIASEESIFRAGDLNAFRNTMVEYEKDVSTLVNDDFHITNTNDKISLGSDIRSLYTKGLLQENLAGAVKYFSDTSFTRSVIRHAELQANYTDVYFYQFSYHGELGGNNIYVEGADRVSHGEDVPYLWPKNANDDYSAYPESDVLTSNRFVTLFTNFAETLNPTPEKSDVFENIMWPKVEPGNFQYLNINDTLEIMKNPKSPVYSGWVNLYNLNAKKPLDTY